MNTSTAQVRARRWLLEGYTDPRGRHPGPHAQEPHRTHSWWKVMCLTGVDYFSTLGYQPAIAAVAAGVISPLATLVLVALTLLGALPVYRRVARESHEGSGSIQMLEKLLPWWGGKLFVLVLLGFAATDFMITITLSSADATAHAIHNPLVEGAFDGWQVPITLGLITLLGLVFLKGFREAIGIAVVLVFAFLALNAIVIVTAFAHLGDNPHVVDDWWGAVTTGYGNPLFAVAVALVVFPKLALGLSGFETGVALMPQIRGSEQDPPKVPRARIAGARKLLTTSALIMSVFLVASSVVTTLLIPQAEFQEGGEANGRALAYLAHEYLGEGFGSAYDIVTIAILWFAGASALAGLLNLVPRYLPRYGMAPQWARAVRPLVLVFIAIAFAITIGFDADVDAQGGAYATGVLVLITTASVAVTLSARAKRQRKRTVGFGLITLVFLYTTVANVIERPDGVRIAAFFIVGILTVSLLSRILRSFQIRATSMTLDETALAFVREDAETYDSVRFVAHEPGLDTEADYSRKLRDERRFNHIPGKSPVIFLEVLPRDSSEFEEDLAACGKVVHGYRVIRVPSGNVPAAIAAFLLEVRDQTGVAPHAYFQWTEGNPAVQMLRFLITGTGEVATNTREILREAEPAPKRRPVVHVS